MQDLTIIELLKCHPNTTIVDAMKIIDKNSYGMLYIVSDDGVLCGCLTDGDIRRWIISGGSVDAPVSKAMNPNPIYVYENQQNDGIKIIHEQNTRSIAVVNKQFCLIDVLFPNPKLLRYSHKELNETPIIIMAGGVGTRLRPFTRILPKPLIPIGDIPILERIMNKYREFGATRFFLSVNYRKEMIKSYFADAQIAYSISYIEEEQPLGTAGSIRLIDEEFKTPVIISNCDILIEADYGDILCHHKKSQNDITIVSALKNTIIPYGVLKMDLEGMVESMEEKPSISSFINTGMYVINPEFIQWIPKEKVFHMTDLVNLMIKERKKVGIYPISEDSFLDMGEFAEMKRMEERINGGISKT